MLSQCNPDGNQYTLIESIVDHIIDDTALTKSQSTFKYKGKQHQQKTTQGWYLCIEWKDGTISWEKCPTSRSHTL